MRILMWFTIGFTAACAAGIYLLLGSLLFILAPILLLGSLLFLLIRKYWSRCTAVVLLGCAVGMIWLACFDGMYLHQARILDGEKGRYDIRICDYGYETLRGVAADGRLELNGRTYQTRVYFDEQLTLQPGDRVSGVFTMRFTAFGGNKAATDHQGKGIFLLAYAEEYSITYGAQPHFSDFSARLRMQITTMLEQVFPGDTAAFAKALLLGDTGDLDYRTSTDFSLSGIRHVVAVSGLHISILFGLIYLLTAKNRWLCAIIGIPILILFAAVAGFTPSVSRACLMQILMIFSMLAKREYDPPTALAFAVLVLLAMDPVTVTSVSFQLSVGCLIGIFLLSQRINGYLMADKRLGRWKSGSWRMRAARWLSGSVSITLGAMALTAPLCALYFGMISLIGIVTNLLVLWLISIIFYGIMLACMLGFLWLPAGAFVGVVISWLIRLVTFTAAELAAFPLAAVYTCSTYILLWLGFCYILLGLTLLMKNKRPWLLSCCAAVCLVLCVLLSWLEPRLDDYRMTVLDVGQGQCILLESEGNRYLVDCGGDSGIQSADLAAEYLLSQGIFSLDGVILTHYDIDHAAGVPYLLTRIPADKLYLPDFEPEDPIRLALEADYANKIQWLGPYAQHSIPEGNITLLTTKMKTSGNESGLCILFQPENCDILITGDRGQSGERDLAEQYDLPLLDVLIVGHHGANGSATLPLLHETRPRIAIISVGVNAYGHPSEDVLDRLALYGCTVLRTDREGTIIIRR